MAIMVGGERILLIHRTTNENVGFYSLCITSTMRIIIFGSSRPSLSPTNVLQASVIAVGNSQKPQGSKPLPSTPVLCWSTIRILFRDSINVYMCQTGSGCLCYIYPTTTAQATTRVLQQRVRYNRVHPRHLPSDSAVSASGNYWHRAVSHFRSKTNIARISSLIYRLPLYCKVLRRTAGI
ncbi:hypothetical protein L210DRAFT_225761 [Boletus edulis BED1]|uniref:Uncharacterized protein n=1 Tax=Boletus edulis BED1 TaxID=1328754 RepID=A0AAD4BR69_BOLED|nr:hypothetical protein L210DRAFT_225761 [Boletus edulis BED1]